MGCLECLPVIVYKVLQGEKFCEISVLNSLWSVKIIIVFFFPFSEAFQRSRIVHGGPNCRGVKPQWNKKYLLYTQTSSSGSLGSGCWVWEAEPWGMCQAPARGGGAHSYRIPGWTWRFLFRVSAWPFLRWSLSMVRRTPNIESIDLFVSQGYSSCCTCFYWTCYQCAIRKQKFKEEMILGRCSK